MKFTDIQWTDKMRSVMKDEAQILFLTGATGCSKTLVAGHKFMDWLLNAPADDTQFFIVFKDRGTGVRNILQNTDSFYNMYDFMREPYSGGKEGGLQFVFHGIYGDKYVYIIGADDRAAWSKILGSNPNGLWLEELSVLHIDCIRECMGRAFSRGCRLLGTTNGGLPTQEFYTEFVNHAEVKYRESVPGIELAEMMEDKPYMHYYQREHEEKEKRDKNRKRIENATSSIESFCKTKGFYFTEEMREVILQLAERVLDNFFDSATVKFGQIKISVSKNAKGVMVFKRNYSETNSEEVV